MMRNSSFRPMTSRHAAREPGRLAVAAGLAAALASPAAAQVLATWNGGLGNWSTGSAWSTGLAPNNGTPAGTTYDVLIPFGSFQLTLDTSVTVNKVNLQAGTLRMNAGRNLTLVDRMDLFFGTTLDNLGGLFTAPLVTTQDGSVIRGSGTFNIGTLDLRGSLEVGGVYQGGVVNVLAGGAVRGTGRYADVTFNIDPGAGQVPFNFQSSGTILDACTINGNFEIQRGVVENGLTLNGTATVTGSQGLRFAGPLTIGGTGTFFLSAPGSNFPFLQIDAPGQFVTIAPDVTVRGGRGSIVGRQSSGLYDGLINQGTIRGDVPGLAFELNALHLINQGVIEAADGGAIELNSSIENNGIIRLVNGGRLNLRNTTPLTGTVDTSGGVVNLLGVYDLAGSTLALGPTSGTWNLGGENTTGNSGEIRNGSVTTSAGQALHVTTSVSKTLRDVAFDGDLSIEGGRLHVRGGSSLSGAVTMDPGTELHTHDTTSIASAMVMDNAAVEFFGTVSFEPGFSMQRTGGSVTFNGLIENTGRTLELNQDTGSWTGWGIDSAIRGGTLRLRDGATLLGVGELDGITLDGILTLPDTANSTTIRNGLTGGQLNYSSGNLTFDGDQTLAGAVIRLDHPTGLATTQMTNNTEVTLGAGSQIRGGSAAMTLESDETIVNVGLIVADQAGRTFTINGAQWIDNQGTLAAQTGGTLELRSLLGGVGDVSATGAGSTVVLRHDSGQAFTLDSMTTASGGGMVQANGTWTNTGQIRLTTGGVFHANSSFATAALGDIASTDGTGVLRAQNWDNTGQTFNLVSRGLRVEIGQSLVGGTVTGDSSHGVSLASGPGERSMSNVILNAPLTVSSGILNTTGVTFGGPTLVGPTGVLNLLGNWQNNGAIHVEGKLGLSGALTPQSIAGITRTQTGQVTLLSTLDLRGLSVSLSNQDLITGIDSPGTLIASSVELGEDFTFGVNFSQAALYTQTLGGPGTLAINGGSLAPDPVIPQSELLIGPATTVDIRNHGAISGHSVVNQGVIGAGSAQSWGRISPLNFVNQGIVQSSGGIMILGANNENGPVTSWTSTGTLLAASGELHLGGSFDSSSLDGLQVLFGTVHLHGIMDNTGDTLTIGAGGIPHLRASNLPNTLGIIAGGVVNVSPGANLEQLTLDSVTLNGSINGLMTYTGGLTLNGTHTGGVRFKGDQTIASGTFNAPTVLVRDDGHIVLATPVVVNAVGSSLVYGERASGSGMSVSLENQGTMSAVGTGNSLTFDVDDGFTNRGLVSASNGGWVRLGGTASPWSNQGVLRAGSLGRIELFGAATLASLGDLDVQAGGLVRLQMAPLDLGGGTLAMDHPGTYELAGTFLNGTLTRGGTSTVAWANPTLTGMTVVGDYSINSGFGPIIRQGLTLQGSLSVPANRFVTFAGSQTLSGGVLNLAGTPSQNALMSYDTSGGAMTVTIASDSQVVGNDARIASEASGSTLTNLGRVASTIAGARLEVTPRVIVNHGTIEALGGSTLRLGARAGVGGVVVNHGTIRATGSRLELAGSFSGSLYDTIDATGSTIWTGDSAVENTGHQIHIPADGNIYELANTYVRGGSLRLDPGGDLRFLNASGVPTLDGVAMSGAFSAANGLVVRGGLSLDGSLSLSSTLRFEGGVQTINAGQIVLGVINGPNATPGTITGSGGTTIRIGPAASVIGGPGFIESGLISGGALTTINQGLIRADRPGQSITIGTLRFINEGQVQAVNGGVIVYNPPLDEPGYAVNSGTMAIGPGSLIEVGGLLELTDSSLVRFILEDPFTSQGSGSLESRFLHLGGRLEVLLAGGYEPGYGDWFDLLDTQARPTGRLDRMWLPTLGDGLSWDSSSLLETGVLRVVPAPGTLGVLLAGVILGTKRRGR